MQFFKLYSSVYPTEVLVKFEDFEAGVLLTWRPDAIGLTPREEAILHAAIGLAGEAGEILEHVKKRIFMNRNDFMTTEAMEKEFGDVEYYITALETIFGLTKEQVCETNNRKLAARYPNGFVQGGGDRTGEGA
jgi:NTP pyrophosphatase (non-canonical NTP hydrolase)